MTLDEYSYGIQYRTRMAELQDIAAMDRLAAEVAPPSALRRYAEQRAGRPDRGTSRGTGGWRRLLHAGRPHQA
jgi:hypothetical protein